MQSNYQHIITIAKCSIYNLQTQPPQSLHIQLRSQDRQVLLHKNVKTVVTATALQVPLNLKITYTHDQNNIDFVLSSPQNTFLIEIQINLNILSQVSSQCFTVQNGTIIKISTQNPFIKTKVPQISAKISQNNEEFIKKRQNFLQKLKTKHEQFKRQWIKTPQFHKSPQKYQSSVNQRIQQLLNKTKQLKQQQLIPNTPLNDNIFRKKEPLHHQHHRISRLMPSASSFELQQEQIIHKGDRIIHQHHHHYSPIQKFDSAQKNKNKKMEISNMICRTNDSESVSSQEQGPHSLKPIFNAKLPFKYQQN